MCANLVIYNVSLLRNMESFFFSPTGCPRSHDFILAPGSLCLNLLLLNFALHTRSAKKRVRQLLPITAVRGLKDCSIVHLLEIPVRGSSIVVTLNAHTS